MRIERGALYRNSWSWLSWPISLHPSHPVRFQAAPVEPAEVVAFEDGFTQTLFGDTVTVTTFLGIPGTGEDEEDFDPDRRPGVRRQKTTGEWALECDLGLGLRLRVGEVQVVRTEGAECDPDQRSGVKRQKTTGERVGNGGWVGVERWGIGLRLGEVDGIRSEDEEADPYKGPGVKLQKTAAGRVGG